MIRKGRNEDLGRTPDSADWVRPVPKQRGFMSPTGPPAFRPFDAGQCRREWSGKFREDEKAAFRETRVWFAEDLLQLEGDRLIISDAYRGEPIILAGYYQDSMISGTCT